jgi:RHS repeat-associated protein
MSPHLCKQRKGGPPAEGRVLQVKQNGSTINTYVYNSRGMRAGISGNEFLLDLSGNLITTIVPGTTTLRNNRYYLGSRLFAAYVSSGSTTDFYHSDWLGATKEISSLSGTSLGTCYTLTFGDGDSCAGSGIWDFAGLMNDPWDSLDTSATRSYSPAEARWIVPDPAGLAAMDTTNPQSWNRYAYVLNNPLNYRDPLGLYLCNCDDGDNGDDDDDGGGGGGDPSGGDPWAGGPG